MAHRNRLVGAIAASVIALLGGAAPAAAHDAIGVSPSGPLPNTLSINTQAGGITFSAGPFVGNCTMTMDLILNPVIRKALLAPVGKVTNGSLIGCSPAGVTATLLGLPNPTPITYNSFLGTLPNIRGLLIVFQGLSFNFNFPGVGNCLYSGNQPALIDTTVAPEPVILLNGGFFMKQPGSAAACPNPGILTTGPPMLLTQTLTLTLIDD